MSGKLLYINRLYENSNIYLLEMETISVNALLHGITESSKNL